MKNSRDTFAIPHDLHILKEVFTLEPGGYRRHNAFWDGYAIRDLIEQLPADQRDPLRARAARIADEYDRLSEAYRAGKTGNAIPLN